MQSSNYHPPRRRDSELRSIQRERREIQFSPEEQSMMDEKSQARAEARHRYNQMVRDEREYHAETDRSQQYNSRRNFQESENSFYDYDENRKHLRYASPDFNTGYSHDANRPLPRDFVSSSNYEENKRLHQGVDPEYRGDHEHHRHDQAIEDDISHILSQHRNIDGRDIDVSVSEGIVTLTGFVPERRMRYIAEDLSITCFGVIDVNNHLRVRRGAKGDARFSGRKTYGRQA